MNCEDYPCCGHDICPTYNEKGQLLCIDCDDVAVRGS